MLHQFKTALKEALASDNDTRRMMRARSAKQRFPVAQWIADLDKLQSKAITIHQKEAPRRHGGRSASPRGRNRLRRLAVSETDSLMSGFDRPSSSTHSPDSQSTTPRGRDSSSIRSTTPDPVRTPITSPGTLGRTLSLGRRAGPGHAPALGPSINIVASTPMSPHQRSDTWETLDTVTEGDEPEEEGSDEWFLTAAEVDDMRRGLDRDRMSSDRSPHRELLARALTGRRTPSPRFLSPRSRSESAYSSPESTPPGSPPVEARHLPASPLFSAQNDSTLSLDLVVGTSKYFSLQNVDANFTDSDEMYYQTFEQSLHQLDKGNSEKSLCIEGFLEKSEKEWFAKYRAAKNARSRESSAAPLLRRPMSSNGPEKGNFQSLLGDNYQPPSLIRRVAQWRIGDWPLYSLFLALGQILAATSYQITLLSGTIKQDDVRFYTITTIYLVTSVVWWYLFRRLKAVYVLSTPFVFYGLAFLMLGLAPLVHSTGGKGWMLNVASGMYATASSSGSLFFAMNFGDEGGSPVKAWIYRCCVVQGTQQIYILALWFWGDYITKLTNRGIAINTSTTDMTIVMCPVAGLLFIIGLFIFTGLPDYYRQDPGQVPSFYSSLFRRHIVVWFWVAVILQNLILSSQYGRNWEYLWSSNHAKVWQIVVLTLGFFILVWAAILFLFSHLSKTHTWILPIFAIGLGAPRWAQTLWSCSNIGLYLPWAGSALASTILGRSLWLWLGVLDALQGVGFGMILLQTLTRVHISAALIGSQVLGSAATMLAHAAQSGSGDGPGTLFPSFAAGALPGLASPWFWVGLISQLFVCVGFFAFFRKEQLSKP
jgi:alpha-1,3-glucan synthase